MGCMVVVVVVVIVVTGELVKLLSFVGSSEPRLPTLAINYGPDNLCGFSKQPIFLIHLLKRENTSSLDTHTHTNTHAHTYYHKYKRVNNITEGFKMSLLLW